MAPQQGRATVKGSRDCGPPGLRNPIPLRDKARYRCQISLGRMLWKLPKEVRDNVLVEYLKGLNIKSSDASYEEYLGFPAVFRRALGERGTLNLTSEDQINKFIWDSSNFRCIFGPRGITFRNLYCIQTVFPSSAHLSLSLGTELAFSSVTHLSIHCGGEPDFLRTLRQWDGALGRLEVLRVKYIVFVDENEDDEVPWEDPLWIEVLQLCQNLRVLLLKTPLPVSGENDWSCRELVPVWARNLSNLRRIYIFHAYDKSCYTGDFLWQGSNILHSRSASGSDVWNSQHVRPGGFCARLPFRRYVSWTTVAQEDVDPYDSDDAWVPEAARETDKTDDDNEIDYVTDNDDDLATNLNHYGTPKPGAGTK